MEHSTTRTGNRMRQGRPPLVILLLAALLTATRGVCAVWLRPG